MLVFVVGAAFGEVYVSLFVTGTPCGEIWNDRRSEQYCNFAENLLLASTKSKLGSVAGSILRFLGQTMLGSISDHSRIGRALAMTLHLFSANFCQMLDGYFAWQVQYLVRLEGDTCCSVYCK